MSTPFHPLHPGDAITTKWLNEALGSCVRTINVSGEATGARVSDCQAIHVDASGGGGLDGFTAVITGNDNMEVPNPDNGLLMPHKYRWKYAFREIQTSTECLDYSGSPKKPCTQSDATSISYLRLPPPIGRTGTVLEGWAFNISELNHSFKADADGRWWVWGRNVKASFYPKLYKAVPIGGDFDGSHARDYPVWMYEAIDDEGLVMRFFSEMGQHIGEC